LTRSLKKFEDTVITPRT